MNYPVDLVRGTRASHPAMGEINLSGYPSRAGTEIVKPGIRSQGGESPSDARTKGRFIFFCSNGRPWCYYI